MHQPLENTEATGRPDRVSPRQGSERVGKSDPYREIDVLKE